MNKFIRNIMCAIAFIITSSNWNSVEIIPENNSASIDHVLHLDEEGGFGSFFSSIGNGIKGAAETVGGGFKSAGEGFVNGFKSAAEATANVAKTAAEATANAAKAAANATGNFAKGGFNFVTNTAFNAVKDGVMTGVNTVGSGFMTGVNTIGGGVMTGVHGVESGVMTGVGGVLTGVNAVENAAITTGNAFAKAGIATGDFFKNDVGPYMETNWPMFAQIALIAVAIAFPELEPELTMVGQQLIQMGTMIQAEYDPKMAAALGMPPQQQQGGGGGGQEPQPSEYRYPHVTLLSWNGSNWSETSSIKGKALVAMGDFGTGASFYQFAPEMVTTLEKVGNIKFDSIVLVQYNSFAPLKDIANELNNSLAKSGDGISEIVGMGFGIGGLLLRDVIQSKSPISSKFTNLVGFAVPNNGANVDKNSTITGGIINMATTPFGQQLAGWSKEQGENIAGMLAKVGPDAMVNGINENIKKKVEAQGADPAQAPKLSWQKNFVEDLFVMRSPNDWIVDGGNVPKYISDLNQQEVPSTVKYYFCGFDPFNPANQGQGDGEQASNSPYLGKDANDGCVGINSAVPASLDGKGGFNSKDVSVVSKTDLGKIEVKLGTAFVSPNWPHGMCFVNPSQDGKSSELITLKNDTTIMNWLLEIFSGQQPQVSAAASVK